MLSRREFLHRTSLVSLYPVVPLALTRLAHAAAAQPDAKVLVVIQLDGGNDGINTVVPFGDDGYGRNREALRLDVARLHKINELVGLHPQMRAAKELYDDGRLTIVQGVGYPNPNRSHFESMRIWQTARFDTDEHQGYGWLGRALDLHASNNNGNAVSQPGAIYAGPEEVPVALWGRRSEAISLTGLGDMKMPFATSQLAPNRTAAQRPLRQKAKASSFSLLANWFRPIRRQSNSTNRFVPARKAPRPITRQRSWPPTWNLFRSLSKAARRHACSTHSRAVTTRTPHSSIPTRSCLASSHPRSRHFSMISRATGLEDRVITLAFSEFGRRMKENSSQGTDHGAAGPVFVAGRKIGGRAGGSDTQSFRP